MKIKIYNENEEKRKNIVENNETRYTFATKEEIANTTRKLVKKYKKAMEELAK